MPLVSLWAPPKVASEGGPEKNLARFCAAPPPRFNPRLNCLIKNIYSTKNRNMGTQHSKPIQLCSISSTECCNRSAFFYNLYVGLNSVKKSTKTHKSVKKWMSFAESLTVYRKLQQEIREIVLKSAKIGFPSDVVQTTVHISTTIEFTMGPRWGLDATQAAWRLLHW